MSTNPTWYDVLGVPHDASPEQIKAAWRHATDKFEPGTGASQFRMFNEAADVLLDPARRAEYDASLAASGRVAAAEGPDDVPPPAPGPEPVSLAKARREEQPPVPEPTPEPVVEPAAASGPPTRGAVLLAAALALLLVVALGLTAYFALQVRRDGRIADARDAAPATAERAAKAMLSYDYRTLPADRKRAEGFLTDSFQKKYDKTFTLLEKNKDGSPGAAVQTKTVVKATVLGSGVVDVEDGVARVLVYVNQVSQKEGAQPQIFQNRVTMTMEREGNRWLVNDLKSY